MRLSSASFPTGGFSYSQALESAVAHRRVKDLDGLKEWLTSALITWARSDALIWAISYKALCKKDLSQLASLNSLHWASRDTSELRVETEQMGWSLMQLVRDLGWIDAELNLLLAELEPPTFLTSHVCTCWSQKIDRESGLLSFCLVTTESQIQAAQKLLSIGQGAAQRLLSDMQTNINQCVSDACQLTEQGESAIHTSAPLHSILSARHEFQYSRLFRS